MTREIKFRGKRIDNGEWVYGSLITRYTTSSGDKFVCRIKLQDGWRDQGEEYVVDPATVGQLTGLKDKNGKEIFQSDFINTPIGIMLVVWHDGFASFGLRKNGWLHTHFFGEAVNPNDCEVIGNLHENPELLPNP